MNGRVDTRHEEITIGLMSGDDFINTFSRRRRKKYFDSKDLYGGFTSVENHNTHFHLKRIYIKSK